MNFKSSALFVLMISGVSAAVHADCSYPNLPVPAPNGATAAEAELAAAVQDMKRFNSEITAYTACVDQDAAAQISAGGTVIASDEIKKIKSESAQKHNAAVDDLEQRASALNGQIKAFKARPAVKG